MRSAFLICLLISSGGLWAQDLELSTPHPSKDSLRDGHIQLFPNDFFVYPVLKQRTLSFELEKADRSRLLTFRPNRTYSFGVGLYLFEVGAELAFAIPVAEKKTDLFGKSKARDIQFNLLGKKFGLDMYYQRYRGFYITDNDNEPGKDLPYPQRGDIISRNLGVTGSYIFNNRKFSLRSVYNFSEKQIFSKGSFLALVNLGRFTLEADSSILDPTQEVIFSNNVSFKKLHYSTFSVAPGYSYNLIYRSFFLNGTLGIGPAHHWIYYQRETGAGRHETGINSFVAARLGIGYNGDRIFGGIAFLTQGSNVKFEDVRFSNNNASFKILMGYRFKEWGKLKKRAWDQIPFKL
jgi:hypothetical protein